MICSVQIACTKSFIFNAHSYSFPIHIVIHLQQMSNESFRRLTTNIHTYTQTCICICMPARSSGGLLHTYIYTYNHTHIHTYTHTHTYKHTHTHTCMRFKRLATCLASMSMILSYMRTCMHACIHTYLHEIQEASHMFGLDVYDPLICAYINLPPKVPLGLMPLYMHVCIHVRMGVCTYACMMLLCVYVSTTAYIYVYTHTYIYTHVYLCMSLSTNKCACIQQTHAHTNCSLHHICLSLGE
jgi:hypothetical protein